MRRNRGPIISFTALIMCVYVGLKVTIQNLADEDDSLAWDDLSPPESRPANVSDSPSVVLFTTFRNQPDRMFLQYNTLRNWASLRPFVQPVLFTTSRQGDGNDMLEQVARESGWHLYQAPAVTAAGLPLMRPMFEMIDRKYSDVMFRGYSNGDVLYDDSLARTLSVVLQHIVDLNKTVLFGNRTICEGNPGNVNVRDNKFLRKWATVNSSVDSNGTKAYVILNGPFPWEYVPGLVVGRRGFDNFLINLAKTHGATAIDTTLSLLAVHQSATGALSTVPNDLDHNEKVVANEVGLAKVAMTNTTSARYETRKDFLGNVYLVDWEASEPKPVPPPKTKKKPAAKPIIKDTAANRNTKNYSKKKDGSDAIKSADTKVDKTVENKGKIKITNAKSAKSEVQHPVQRKARIKQDTSNKAVQKHDVYKDMVVKH